MEDVFRDIFFDFVDLGGDAYRSAYVDLVDLYMTVLRDTTNWLSSDTRTGGPVGRLVAAAADTSETVTVVMFNHDLVIENEIAKRAWLWARWCLDDGYGEFAGRLDPLVFRQPDPPPMLPLHENGGCDQSKQALRADIPALWDEARAALETANRVVFSGYSLPRIGVEAEKLCERGIARNRKLGWVDVVIRHLRQPRDMRPSPRPCPYGRTPRSSGSRTHGRTSRLRESQPRTLRPSPTRGRLGSSRTDSPSAVTRSSCVPERKAPATTLADGETRISHSSGSVAKCEAFSRIGKLDLTLPSRTPLLESG